MMIGRIGERTIEKLRSQAWLAAVTASVFRQSLRPACWPRTVCNVLARQIYFTGVEATRFIVMVALLVGLTVVVQAQVWLALVGQSALVGPLLVAVVIRELGPLLTNFVIIGRSGTAIATELATMKVNGEIRVLDSQGLDPFTYLVIPRVIGVAVSVFCATLVFLFVAIASGFLSALFLGTGGTTSGLFLNSVLGAIRPADIVNVVAKTLIPGALTGAICCIEGLGVAGAATEVPQAAGRAVIRSVAVLFVTSTIVSVLTYI